MKYLYFLLLFASINSGFAQRFEEKNTEISVNYGIAVPLGDFSATDASNKEAGYAESGTNLNAWINYLIAKNIGIVAMVSSSSNRINTGSFRQQYDAVLDTLEGTISDFQSGKWYTVSYMAGPCLVLPVKSLTFEVRLLAGLAKTEFPQIDVTVYSLHYTDAVKWVQEKTSESSFGFNVGAGMKYTVSDILFIGLHADYFSVKQKFKSVKTVSNIGDDSEQDATRPISMAHITFGIGFRF